MKKIMLFASALAGLFLAASCQQENLEPVMSGNTVTYTVQVADAVSTKVIGEKVDDVAAVTQLIYEVYRIDENGNESRLYQMEETITDGTATVELELVNNQDFHVLFWAQVPNNGVYNTASLKAVTLSQDLDANAENYAAFAGEDSIEYGVDVLAGRTITLYRPVAQLNIATTPESLKLGEDQNGDNAQTNVSFEKTSVVVEGLSTVYNVATNTVDTDNATFTYEAMPVDLSEETLTVNGKSYEYVSMNYVGFAPTSGDQVKVTYTIQTNEVGTITNTIDNVPVKPNYRTNIVGNLITSISDYTVTLSKDWATPDYNVEVVSVETASELQGAIAAAPADGTETNIKLEGDIDLSMLASLMSTKANAPAYSLNIPAGKSFVLDLNGCTLKQTIACESHYSMIKNDGNLTITDSKNTGKITFTDRGNGDPNFGWGSYTIENCGELIIENGTVENATTINPGNGEPNVHMYCAIQQNNGNAVTIINGGKISTPTYRSIRICSGELIINGGVCEGQVWMQPFAEGSSINITGGQFSPRGNDGSSVYVENSNKTVGFAVSGGYFSTKLGASNPAALKGVTGGSFVVDPSEFVATGYYAEYNGVTGVYEIKPYKVGTIVTIGEQKGIVFSVTDEAVKVVSVAQGGEMTWNESMAWAKGLGEGWNLSTLEELTAVYNVRKALNVALAADDAANVLFEEDNKEEDGSYAAYWTSTLVESNSASQKAYYMYFDNKGRSTTSFTMFPVEYSRAVYTLN